MVTDRRNFIRLFEWKSAILAGSLIASSLMVSACAGYDVELDAPILNAAGIDLSANNKKQAKLKDRPPLVVPPSPKLPEPGTIAKAPENIDWPDDPDVRAKKLAELKRQQEIAEGKAQTPVTKAISKAVEQMRVEDDVIDETNPAIEKKSAESEVDQSSGISEGWNSNIDMEKRTIEKIR